MVEAVFTLVDSFLLSANLLSMLFALQLAILA
jgi:hypothetical protein